LSSGADRCLRCFALNPQNTQERALPATGGAPQARSIGEERALPATGGARTRGASNAGPLFAGLESDPPKEVRVRFDDEPGPGERPPAIEKTPAPPPKLERATDPDPERQVPRPPRFDPKTFLLAWAIDFGAVAALTALHAGLAVAVIGPESLAPGSAGSIDYWLDLFRGGGLWMFWLLLAATLALAYCAVSALLLGRTPGLALATRGSRLPPERSAP
jgi:hypothetical protein